MAYDTRIFGFSQKTLVVLAILVGTSGFVLAHLDLSGKSDIEKTLAASLRWEDNRSVDMSIRRVNCQGPNNGAARTCVVTFRDDFAITPKTVQVPASDAIFPAEFEFEHRVQDLGFSNLVYRISVKTPYNGAALNESEAVQALITTLRAAASRAVQSTNGAYQRQRAIVVNRDSFEAQ